LDVHNSILGAAGENEDYLKGENDEKKELTTG
jgi:hypothetical protein